MIKTNIHTHTIRCGHAAIAEDKEYIEAAIKAGYTTLGFSDHCYNEFANTGTYPPFFSHDDETYQDYISSIRKLREEYKDKIEIHIGFEVEYQKEFFDEAVEYYKQVGGEYLILGQHACLREDGKGNTYSGAKNRSIESFDKYIEDCIEGMKTGYFTYLAHPDLFKYIGDEDIYYQKIEYFISKIKEYDIPVEFNLHGFATNRNYPNYVFWKLAGENGIDAILGVDAHNPKEFLDVEVVERAIDYLNSLNVKVVEPTIKKL